MRQRTGICGIIGMLGLVSSTLSPAHALYLSTQLTQVDDAVIVDFNIASGSLVEALQRVSEQADRPIGTRMNLTHIRTTGVVGRLSVSEALARLLDGSGFEAVEREGGFVIASVSVAIPHLVYPVDSEVADPVMPIEWIEVTGFRQALFDALRIKRSDIGISDVIIASDIARFADLNLAEAVQRLPGVAINREAGEGRRITLRGLGPGFTRVELNGMPVTAGVDSPMDSRGQRTRDRAFDFNVFSADLFTRIDVDKTFSADQREGGLAGTVRLYTPRPLEVGASLNQITARVGTNDRTEDISPQLTARWVWQPTSRFGVAVSGAYSQRETEEQGYNTYRWRHLTGGNTDLSALDPVLAQRITEGKIAFARGNRLSVWGAEQSRFGVVTTLQWQVNPSVQAVVDLMHGQFDSDRQEWHLASRGLGSTWLDGDTRVNGQPVGPTRLLELDVDANGDAVYLVADQATTASETRIQRSRHRMDQLSFGLDWDLSGGGVVRASGGWQTSSYDLPKSDKFYLEALGPVTTDYRADRFYGRNTYGWDVDRAQNWRAHEVDRNRFYRDLEQYTARLDVQHPWHDGLEVHTGLAWQRYANSGRRDRLDDLFVDVFESGALDDDPTLYARRLDRHADQAWTVVDQNAAFERYGVEDIPIPVDQVWRLREETLSAYLQTAFRSQPSWGEIRGEAGVRYSRTRTQTRVGLMGQDRNTGETSDWLPSLEVATEFDGGLVIRMAAYRNINRPPVDALAAAVDVEQMPDDSYRISAGNPDLRPFRSDNLDVSLEWYPSGTELVSAALFFKQIDGFIGTQVQTDLSFAETGLAPALAPALTAQSRVAEFTRSINLEDADLMGLELAWQSELDFLPGLPEPFGFLANLTLAEGEVNYASPDQRARGETAIFGLEGLSDVTWNASVYYETSDWGVRVSAHHRSDYVSRGGATGSDEDHRGFNATTYVDLAAFAYLGTDWRWSLDVINLTDEREEQYSDSTRRLYNATTSGVTVYTGLTRQF